MFIAAQDDAPSVEFDMSRFFKMEVFRRQPLGWVRGQWFWIVWRMMSLSDEIWKRWKRMESDEKLSLRFGAFLLEFKKIWNFLLEQVRYWLVQYGYPKMAMFFSRNYCMFSKVSFLMSMLDVKILHLPRAPIQAPIMLNYSRQKQPARCGFTGFNPGSSEPSFKSYPFCHEETWKWKNDCIWVEIYHISLNHDYDYDYRGVYTSIYVHIKRLCRHLRYLERYR